MAITKTINIDIKSGSSKKEVEKLTQDVKKLDQTTKETTNSSAGGFNNMANSIGGLSPTLGKAQNGMKGVLTQMKAIVANPLGLILVAIVGALTLLYKAFTSTKEGAEKLEQVMAGMGAVIDVVRDRILNVGNAIVKFFSGDFKGAIDEGKKAVSGFGAEVANEFRAAANATKQLQQVNDAMRSLSVTRAKLDRDLAKSKQLLTDENASYAEKKKALDQIRIAEKKQTADELENAQKKLDAIKTLNKQSDSNAEALKEESDAEIALYNLQQKSAEDLRNIQKQEKTLSNEESARLKSISDQRKAAAKEEQQRRKEALKQQEEENKKRLDALEKIRLAEIDTEEERRAEELRKVQEQYKSLILDAEKYSQDTTQLKEAQRTKEKELQDKFVAEDKAKKDKIEADEKAKTLKSQEDKIKELEIDKEFENLQFEEKRNILNERDALILEDTLLTEEQKTKILKENSDARIAIDKAEADAKLAIQNAVLDNVSGGIGVLKQLGEKNKAVQKAAIIAENAVGIARIILNTQAANAKSIAASPLTAGQPWVAVNTISGALSVASSLLATKKALSALGGGSAGTAPSVSGGSGGGSSTAPAAPQFNVVGNTGVNQIAETLGSQQPVQAYVVANNVTTAQSLDRNIISNASLG